MFIKNIKLENFRGVKSAEIFFDGRSAVLFGENGMGKSTILDAIDILLFRIIKKVANPLEESLKYGGIKHTDLTIGEKKTSLELNLVMKANGKKEYSYGRYLEAFEWKYTFDGKAFNKIVDDFLSNYVGDKLPLVSKEEEEFFEEEQEAETLVLNHENMPVYVNYGVHRYVKNNALKVLGDKKEYDKLDAFDKKMQATVDFSMFFDWFRLRQEYENSIKVEDSTFYDKQLDAVRKAILEVLGGEFETVKMRVNPLNFIAVKKGMELNLAQLSEGEKCTLALVGDLARRLAIANPSRENPLEGTGIVLLDEVDLHLHPKWQLKIVPLLQEIFPNIQFIFTTHSPKVLGELDDTISIFELKERDGEIEVIRQPSMQGWDTNHILKEFMDTPNVSEKASRLIRSIRDSIKEENYDKADELVDQLCEMTDGLNEEVVRARAIIARRRRNL